MSALAQDNLSISPKSLQQFNEETLQDEDSNSEMYPAAPISLIKKKISKPDSQKQKKSERQNNQIKRVIFGVNSINNYLSIEQYTSFFDLSIQKLVPSQKLFFLAGDMIAEMKGVENEDRIQLYKYHRNHIYIEKTKKGVSFEIESFRPLKDFSQPIYYLENLQDKDSYEFAQYLKKHQQVIFKISSQLQEIQNFYLNGIEDLQYIIKERSEFIKEQRRKLIEEFCSDDDFCLVTTESLSFENQTKSISNRFMSKPLIALVGGNYDDTCYEFLKYGSLKVLDENTRNKMDEFCIKATQEGFDQYELQIDDFQLNTIDNIKITCKTRIRRFNINYPKHLQFQYFPDLNKIEKFILVHHEINFKIIQDVLKIRQQMAANAPQNQPFPHNYDYNGFIDYDKFQQSMQSQIFLEKFYQKEMDDLNKQIDQPQQSSSSQQTIQLNTQ
ncbi:hypothetical protein TTHERM_00770630 (macronuclear) [Tetrahymena thermophila SB210]|uniref:Uncharacterized protein n=1 Tax=Tetrahymena thermophila (strain SB210) TaxID=312017 RepID=Q23AT2_TETTS|nr:hypothetical protein TTHERM_00770630 [Tetrahymena thermophila SB210]EAR93610.1 hypothetical protein TTHERM_00770630 [Tetrahymena thermophila SB210]|eukprot:XP_001013855.1 hypothetical protein TTHERM_00770630 [Tetrahymena thermophila SB210]